MDANDQTFDYMFKLLIIGKLHFVFDKLLVLYLCCFLILLENHLSCSIVV